MKLRKLHLNASARVLSTQEMKSVCGGGWGYYCHCYDESDGHSEPANSCRECADLCGGKDKVQNCNYIQD